MVDMIDRTELNRIIINGNQYNSKCPEWIQNVIDRLPKATDTMTYTELVYLAADLLKLAHEKGKEDD